MKHKIHDEETKKATEHGINNNNNDSGNGNARMQQQNQPPSKAKLKSVYRAIFFASTDTSLSSPSEMQVNIYTKIEQMNERMNE